MSQSEEDRITALERSVAELTQALGSIRKQVADEAAARIATDEKIEAVQTRCGDLLSHVAQFVAVDRRALESELAEKLPEIPSAEETNSSLNGLACPPASEKPATANNHFVNMWAASAEFRERYAAVKTEAVGKKTFKTTEDELRAIGRASYGKLKGNASLEALYKEEHARYKASFSS